MPDLPRTSWLWPWPTSSRGSLGRCCRVATTIDQQPCQPNQRGKARLRLGSATRSHFPALRRPLKLSTEVCTGQQGRKNSHNGVSAACSRQWSSMTERLIRTDTRASHPGQETQISTRRPNTFAQTCLLDQTSPCSRAADHTLSRPIMLAVSMELRVSGYRRARVCLITRLMTSFRS